MRASEVLDSILDTAGDMGRIHAAGEDGTVEIDAVVVGPIGVRVRSVRIGRTADVDIAVEAETLPNRIRTLPHRVVPVEVDPGLGGAILRSRPEDIREREFWEVDVRRRTSTIRKQRVGGDGQREAVEFVLTREQLRHLLDELR